MTISNLLTCSSIEMIEQLVQHESLLRIYMIEGPKLTQDKFIIMSVLDTVEKFGKLDIDL